MKKLEIIIDYIVLNKLLEKLDSIGVSGYTVLKDVMGKGSQGNKDGHGLLAGFKNCMVILIINDNEQDQVIEAISPFIKSYGGLCTVTSIDYIVSR